MIDLEQVQDGISRINDVDVRLVSRPGCVLYSAVAPRFWQIESKVQITQRGSSKTIWTGCVSQKSNNTSRIHLQPPRQIQYDYSVGYCHHHHHRNRWAIVIAVSSLGLKKKGLISVTWQKNYR